MIPIDLSAGGRLIANNKPITTLEEIKNIIGKVIFVEDNEVKIPIRMNGKYLLKFGNIDIVAKCCSRAKGKHLISDKKFIRYGFEFIESQFSRINK